MGSDDRHPDHCFLPSPAPSLTLAGQYDRASAEQLRDECIGQGGGAVLQLGRGCVHSLPERARGGCDRAKP